MLYPDDQKLLIRDNLKENDTDSLSQFECTSPDIWVMELDDLKQLDASIEKFKKNENYNLDYNKGVRKVPDRYALVRVKNCSHQAQTAYVQLFFSTGGVFIFTGDHLVRSRSYSTRKDVAGGPHSDDRPADFIKIEIPANGIGVAGPFDLKIMSDGVKNLTGHELHSCVVAVASKKSDVIIPNSFTGESGYRSWIRENKNVGTRNIDIASTFDKKYVFATTFVFPAMGDLKPGDKKYVDFDFESTPARSGFEYRIRQQKNNNASENQIFSDAGTPLLNLHILEDKDRTKDVRSLQAKIVIGQKYLIECEVENSAGVEAVVHMKMEAHYVDEVTAQSRRRLLMGVSRAIVRMKAA